MNAVIYARYSSDNQREESIEGQLRECTDYANKHGISIVGTYIDRAFSAKTDARPEFQRMIKDSAKRQFEIVLVWKLDRFSRSRTDSAVNKAVLRKHGAKVISVTENISDRADGILLEAVLEGMAEYYSAELSEKIVRGLTENALKGKYNGGGLPLGYRVDSEQHFEIDPVSAPVVHEIFQCYADGETVTAITDSLNQRGVRSSRNATFNKNSLHKMLKNRKYIGEYQYRDIVHENAIPAIIEQNLFDKVQQRLARNRKAPAMPKAKAEYLLTTKLFCGLCGAFMVGESGTSKTERTYHYYKCANAKRGRACKKKTVKKEWIEHLVVAKTKELLLNDTAMKKMADDLIEYQTQGNSILPSLRQQLVDVEKRIANLMNAIEEGIRTDTTRQRLEELEERKADLEISIAQEQIEKPALTKEQILVFLKRFHDGDVNDHEYRKHIIDVFVNAVYLYDDKVVLMYNSKDGT
ncbi:recombinase family protein, partial [Eubacteriales bacterium OttesenSCG-928-N14]|nr:recombinase family protein [Eubacteriales bacterium OttesenSCG-928-N14]